MTHVRNRSAGRWIVVVWLACISVAGSAALAPAVAEEPAQRFLDALREQRFYDAALDYLESLQGNALVPIEFRQKLDYERGVTLVNVASIERNLELRESLLNQAQQALQQFVQANPNHYLVPSAKRQFGNLLMQRARILVEQRKREPASVSADDARGKFDEAHELYIQSQDELREKLEGMKAIPQTEKELIERRDILRAEYLEAQLLAAAVLEEKATVEDADSAAAKKLLEDAARQYGEIYEKYRLRLAGAYARMYQGRCLQKSGQYDEALAYYVADLLDQPDSPDPYRRLKTLTLQLAMECWISQKKYSEAISRTQEWLKKARPAENQDLEWMKLRLALADAYQRRAEQLKEENPRDKQIKALLGDARKEALALSRMPGPLQRDAREFLANLPGGLEQPASQEAPKTYDEAYEAGKEALGAIESARFVLSDYPQRIADESDDSIRVELQKTLDEAKETLGTSRIDAIEAFEIASELADDEVPLETINEIRYYRSFLMFEEGDYPESYVLGHFVATRYPDDTAAKQCGKIAMAAALKMYAAAADQKDFESQLVTDIAAYLSRTWAGEPEAIDAVNTLIPFELQRGRLDEAEKLLESIPADAEIRHDSEIRVGQAVWSRALKAMAEFKQLREQQDNPLAASPEVQEKQKQVDTLRERAVGLLEKGVQGLPDGAALDRVRAAGILSLVQAHVENGDAQKALELLEDGNVGLLEPVSDGQFDDIPGFSEEVLRQALRAVIGVLPQQSGADAGAKSLERAKEIMALLKKRTGTSPEGARRLLSIYYSMARDLDAQIKARRDPEEQRVLAAGFQTFLQEVANESNEFNVLNWVAESFYALAKVLDTDRQVSPAAKELYSKSAGTFDRILKLGAQQPDLLSAQQKMQLQLRRAMVRRDEENFEQAVQGFRDVLAVRNTLLNVQMESARTYQEWALAAGEPEKLQKALQGAYPKDKKNLIWGWIKLAALTIRREDLRSTFHEAQWNRAYCRYQYALMQKNSSDKTRNLKTAKREVLEVGQQFPDWGGPEQLARYENLIKMIQKSLGEPTVGLPREPAGSR